MLIRRDEQGSLAIAMAVIMILTTLALGGLARTLTVLRAARQNQDFNANLTNADSGLSDALFRLDQGTTGTFTSAASETRFRYTATPIASTSGLVESYDVKAVGIVNGRLHGIQATLVRRRAFPYAVYARHDVDLSGGGTPAICGTVDPVSGTYYPAILGSSGTITLLGGTTGPPQPTPTSSTAPCQTARGADGQDSYAPSGTCVNCYTATSVYRSPDAQRLTADQAPIQTDITSAPAGASPQCSFAGAISAGTYVCTGDLAFTADATVPQTGPPVIIYELNGGALKLNQKNINYSSIGPGNSAQLRIYKGGVGIIDIGSSGTTQLSAAVSAPFSTLTGDGQTFHFAGSMVLDTYTYNGQTGFTFSYNLGAASVTRDWAVGYYREIPASQVP